MLFLSVPDSADDLVHETDLSASSQSLPGDFYKYHILRLGNDYYMTTNPTMKHLQCRHGPGVYVAIDHESSRISVSIYDDNARCLRLVVTIDKHLGGQGGVFEVTHASDEILVDAPLSHGNGFDTVVRTSCSEAALPYSFLPYPFLNFKYADEHNMVWNIGRIPQVKPRSMVRVKSRILSSSNPPPIKTKFCNEGHIYLHSSDVIEPTHEPLMIRLLPQIGAFFRPCEYSMKSRLSHTASSLKRSLNAIHRSSLYHRSESHTPIHSLAAGSDVRSFYAAESGFLASRTRDDCPNHEKMGWITVFDRCMRKKADLPVILGLVFAVALDARSDHGEKQHEL